MNFSESKITEVPGSSKGYLNTGNILMLHHSDNVSALLYIFRSDELFHKFIPVSLSIGEKNEGGSLRLPGTHRSKTKQPSIIM